MNKSIASAISLLVGSAAAFVNVGTAAADDVERRVANDGRGDAVLGEIKRVDGEGVKFDCVVVVVNVNDGDGDGAVAGGSSHDGLRICRQRVGAVRRAEHFAVDGDRGVERGLMRGTVHDLYGERCRGAGCAWGLGDAEGGGEQRRDRCEGEKLRRWKGHKRRLAYRSSDEQYTTELRRKRITKRCEEAATVRLPGRRG